jgi:hypothetical protein
MAAAAAASSSSAAAKPIGKYDYGLNKKPTARTRVVTKAKLDRMVYAVLSAQMGMDWNGYKDFELARAQRLDASTGLQEYLQPSHQEDEPLNASAIYDQEGSAQRIRVQFGVREQLVEGLVKKLHPEFGVVGIHKITLEPTLDLDRPIDLDWSNHSIARVASRLLPKEYGMGTLHAIKVWEILIGITPTFEQRKKFLRAIAAENRRRDGGRDWSDAGREAFANVPNGVGRYMEYMDTVVEENQAAAFQEATVGDFPLPKDIARLAGSYYTGGIKHTDGSGSNSSNMEDEAQAEAQGAAAAASKTNIQWR